MVFETNPSGCSILFGPLRHHNHILFASYCTKFWLSWWDERFWLRQFGLYWHGGLSISLSLWFIRTTFTNQRQLYIPQFSPCFKTQKKKEKKEKNRKLKNLKDNSCRLNMDTAYCMEWFWAFYSCFLYFAFHFIFMQHYLSFGFSLEISWSYLVLIFLI
jgi:hypothetical protein